MSLSIDQPVTVPMHRLLMWGLLALLGGVAIAVLPSIVQDLRFLHAARIYNEQQTIQQAAQAAHGTPAPPSPPSPTPAPVPK